MKKQDQISCVIIDDEAEARFVLEQLLLEIPEVKLNGSAASAHAGLQLITTTQPDVVLLDIQMPVMSGIELARELQSRRFKGRLVFATAFDVFAIEALRLAAFDYLLKPVDPELLRKVFERIRTQQQSLPALDQQLEMLAKQLLHDHRLRLNTRTGFILIEPREVMAVMAEGNYSRVILTEGREEMITQNIGHMEGLLPEGKFFRASRSCLINLSFVRRYDRKKHLALLENNGFTKEVSIAREKAHAFDLCWM